MQETQGQNQRSLKVFRDAAELISPEQEEKLRNSRVAVRCSRVGPAVELEALARLGIGRFTVAVPDTLDLATDDGQFGANPLQVCPNAQGSREAILGINPGASIPVCEDPICSGTVEGFLEGTNVLICGLEASDVAAGRVAAAGMTAVLPVLFGTPGKPVSAGYLLGQLAHICIRSEFRCFAKRRASPLTDWLRALCRQVHQECGGPGVGVVGMCVTGGFALALAAEPAVLAPVLSQPSLPLFALTRARKEALAISEEELAAAKQRCSAGLTVLGLRFTADRFCPAERFQRLRRDLADAFTSIEIDSAPGNPHGISPRAHCVLTVDLVDEEGHPTREALERVLSWLGARLGK